MKIEFIFALTCKRKSNQLPMENDAKNYYSIMENFSNLLFRIQFQFFLAHKILQIFSREITKVVKVAKKMCCLFYFNVKKETTATFLNCYQISIAMTFDVNANILLLYNIKKLVFPKVSEMNG